MRYGCCFALPWPLSLLLEASKRAGYTQIADISEVAHLTHLPDLRVLWLSDNPCAQVPEYRAKVTCLPGLAGLADAAVLTTKLIARMQVLQMLPQLHKLDNDDVTQASSAEAGARPAPVEANLTAAQPQQPSSVTASAKLVTCMHMQGTAAVQAA